MNKRQQLIEIIEQMQVAAENQDAEKVRSFSKKYDSASVRLYGLNPTNQPGDLDNCRQYFLFAIGMLKENYPKMMREGKKELARIKAL
jgi:hypothetical protein